MTFQLKRFLLLLLFVPAFLLCAAQPVLRNDKTHTTMLSQKAMRLDLSFWVENLKSYHPGLFWHTDEELFIRAVDSLSALMPDSLNEQDFLRHIACLNHFIQDAHTSIDLSEESMNHWEYEVKYTPFNLHKIDSAYYVSESFDLFGNLKPGMEILSINSIPIDEIVQGLLPYIPADGNNTTRKYYALRKGFYYYAKLYGPATHNEVHIEYKDGQEQKSMNLNCVSRMDIQTMRQKNLRVDPDPIYFAWLPDSNLAYLHIRRFAKLTGDDESPYFHSYLDSIFSLMQSKKTPRLIIDLRGNGGGFSEFGAQLVAYLAKEPFYYCESMRLKTNHFPEYLHIDSSVTFTDFPAGISSDSLGYLWQNHSVLSQRQPEDLAFQGKVYVLIDGGCASTCSEVTSVLYQNKLATFYGEEAGGSYEGNSSGVLANFILPNSGLQVTMPLLRYELAVDNMFDGHGVIPQFPVSEDPYFLEDSRLLRVLKQIEAE